MKNPGKTVLVFLSLIVVVLVSGLAISLYLLNKETGTRRSVEATLSEVSAKAASVEAALKDALGQVEVLQGKNKDADDKINALLDDLEIEKGLREEVKKENQKLKDDLEAEARAKIELRNTLAKELDEAQSRLKEIQVSADQHKGEAAALQTRLNELSLRNGELEKQVLELSESLKNRQNRSELVPLPGENPSGQVELDRIVVTPPGKEAVREGRVLNVDTETEFLIFDLGARAGIQQGDILSVMRGKTYLGDVRVSRVQDEMSAADFIPPFSSRKVRKNDQVVAKQ